MKGHWSKRLECLWSICSERRRDRRRRSRNKPGKSHTWEDLGAWDSKRAKDRGARHTWRGCAGERSRVESQDYSGLLYVRCSIHPIIEVLTDVGTELDFCCRGINLESFPNLSRLFLLSLNGKICSLSLALIPGLRMLATRLRGYSFPRNRTSHSCSSRTWF